MKYIDLEKLITEIERRYHKAVDESKYINSAKFVRNELENLREFAYSLQQEQVDFEKEVVSICKIYGITEHLDAELGPLDIKTLLATSMNLD